MISQARYFKTQYAIHCILCFVLLIINPTKGYSQIQNNWVVANIANYYSKYPDSTNFSFHFDFNCEPPCIRVINRKPTQQNIIRPLTISDHKGRLSMYSNEELGFLDAKNRVLNTDTPFFVYDNTSLAFPTNSDSIIFILYRRDSMKYVNSKLQQPIGKGEIHLKYALFNVHSQIFVTYNQELLLDESRFNGLKWQQDDYATAFSFRIFKQYADEKAGNYYFFFNIADSVYTCRYTPGNMQFSKPYFSGMNCDRNKNRNWVSADASEDFIINFRSNKAFYINHGIRDNYPEMLDISNEALILFDFDSGTGKFSNEKLIDPYYHSYPHFFALGTSDTVLYVIKQTDSIKKYVFTSNYASFQVYNIKTPTNGRYLRDIKLAPNGRIYISLISTFANQLDTTLLVIENPNVEGFFIKFSKKTRLFKDPSNEILSKVIILDNFPNTYGSYRRVDFAHAVTCEGLGVKFINNSDTFWFKQYRYYFGDGDSLDFDHKQHTTEHSYQTPGKYWVKLKAFNKAGGWVWFSDSISVRVTPSAYFTNITMKGCQYILFNFKDSSKIAQLKQDSLARHWWDYGDGYKENWQSTNKNARKDMGHIYNTNGIYTVKHIVSDGFCRDTFVRLNQVDILPAPKPGIISSPLEGCTPLKVTLSARYPDNVDSTLWASSAGHLITSIKQSPVQFIFNKTGIFKVMQHQYGPTGCITSDTSNVNVIQGLETSFSPVLINTTVENNDKIRVYWKKVPNAKEYVVFRDNLKIASVPDTFYNDHTARFAEISYSYHIKAVDVCNQFTLNSNTGTSIFLNAEKDIKNFGILRWNTYRSWPNGVTEYQIQHISNSTTMLIMSQNDTAKTSCKDPDFLIDGECQKCYRIDAIESGNFRSVSKSNVVCVPYESVIWIPTAITINGDGINEFLQIHTYGIQSFIFSVYTRWGEKVFETNNIQDTWHPSPQEQGVYMYVIKAVSNYGDYLSKGSITVLR